MEIFSETSFNTDALTGIIVEVINMATNNMNESVFIKKIFLIASLLYMIAKFQRITNRFLVLNILYIKHPHNSGSVVVLWFYGDFLFSPLDSLPSVFTIDSVQFSFSLPLRQLPQ